MAHGDHGCHPFPSHRIPDPFLHRTPPGKRRKSGPKYPKNIRSHIGHVWNVVRFGYGPDSYGSTFPLFAGGSDRASTSLSKATGLKSVTPEHLRQISINIPSDFSSRSASVNIRRVIGETTYEQWLGLDRLLVRFWESYLVRPKMRHSGLCSETTRGLVEFVEP